MTLGFQSENNKKGRNQKKGHGGGDNRKSDPGNFQIFEEWKGISNSARPTWDPGNSWT